MTTMQDEFRIAEIVESRMLELRARLRAELATELHAQFVAMFDERIAKLELDQEVLWDDMQERQKQVDAVEYAHVSYRV